MKVLRLLVLPALCLALPALAQTAPVSTPAAAPVDAARLVIAKTVASRLLPDGVYQKMMSGPMDQMMDNMMGSMKSLPMATLSRVGGISEAEAAALPEGTLGEMMAILDPHFEERQKLTTKIVFSEMGTIMGELEPAMREGMAEAYARRFSVEQLTELDRFFATPTGSAYAGEQMMLMMDPAIMNRMQAMMPKIFQAMPGIMGKVEKATSHLPGPKKPADLSEAEIRKLDALMGKVKKGK